MRDKENKTKKEELEKDMKETLQDNTAKEGLDATLELDLGDALDLTTEINLDELDEEEELSLDDVEDLTVQKDSEEDTIVLTLEEAADLTREISLDELPEDEGEEEESGEDAESGEEAEEVELLADDGEEVAEEEKEEPDLTEEEKAERKEKRMKLFKKIGLSVLAVVLVIYFGFSVYFMNHFQFQTTINGENASMMNVSKVEDMMISQVDEYELIIKESSNRTEKIVGSEIDLTYKKGDELKNLVKKQNAFLWPLSLWKAPQITASVGVEYNTSKLDAKIQALECQKPENQVPPVSAKPEFNGEEFVVKAEDPGSQLNQEVFADTIKAYIDEFQKEIDLEEAGCYVKAKYTSESEEVAKACEEMNKFLKAEITYTFGEAKEVADKAVIATWLATDDNMQVQFSEDAVKQYLQGLSDKYDTYGKERTFTSGNGNAVKVLGGNYGWRIDQQAECQALIESVKKGEVLTKEPAYSSTAASHEATDWGNTYVEVDLTNQYMYLFVNGQVVTSGPVVTGKPSTGASTPQGVYFIKYCARNVTLRGPKKPDGKYEWESPVSFWMPFNGGIGLHDAPWQAAFGGSRYLTHGSHGCVNLQYSVANAVYNNVTAGTPVICHY